MRFINLCAKTAVLIEHIDKYELYEVQFMNPQMNIYHNRNTTTLPNPVQ